jgi:ubiquinone/menaquinone biosynthesis C-methylase UbiE
VQRRELALLLHRLKVRLEDKRILDVGCGSGSSLRRWEDLGAIPRNVFGVDLILQRLQEGRSMDESLLLTCGEAGALPYPAGYFDIECQFTMMSSVIDHDSQARISAEMMRVLGQDGLIISLDMYRPSRRKNARVSGISRERLHELFPGCSILIERVSLHPRLVEPMAAHSVLLCDLLAHIPLLTVHYLAVIRRRRKADD